MDKDILKQLVSIKRWIAAAVVIFAICCAAFIGFSIWSVQLYDNLETEYLGDTDTSKDWDDPAYDAIVKAKYELALKLANQRLETHPNDSDAFYIKAKVAFYQGDFEAAKTLLLQTKALAPSWNAEHIKPLLEAIEQNAYNRSDD